MTTKTTDLFLLEDLEDVGKTSELRQSDLDALRGVADWIRTFVVRPHEELGRAGAVCPFVPGALERRTCWLAPEQIADLDVPAVVELMNGYARLFLDARPNEGDDANYKVIVVVFTDLSADRAQGVFDGVLEQLAVPSYAEDGIVFGPFYQGNEGTAIYNSSFRPFQSPVPFLFVRYGVISDWKFFLDNEDFFNCGPVALENPQSTLSLTNYAACHGVRLAKEIPMSSIVETAAEIRAFRLEIPEEQLDDLRRRIDATRWPSKELVDDRSQGVQLANWVDRGGHFAAWEEPELFSTEVRAAFRGLRR